MPVNNNIENRQMLFFLSSTFQDMQEERDELIKKIFPQLRVVAEQRLVTLTPIDLRWGVTEEESKTGRIIELCLQEIERCHPFFIGILGSHYGWCPSMSDLKGNSMLLDQYEWLRKDIDDGLSITEIEMQYAVLRRQHHANAFFFIKKDSLENLEKDSKLHKLIRNIKTHGQEFSIVGSPQGSLSLGQCNYTYYNSPEELGHLVRQVVVELLDSVFPIGEEDEWTRESRAQQAYLQSLRDIYVPQVNNEIHTFLMDRMSERYMMVSSDEDCFYGKSAFIANWMKQYENEDSHHFVYHSIGAGYFGSDYRKILERICKKVARLYGLGLPTKDEYGHELDYSAILTGLLEKVRDQKPLFIILDGLQHLSDFGDAKQLDWLPVVPENVTLIVTAPYHDATREVFDRRYGYVFYIEAFEEDEERQFVEAYLGKFGKKLSPHQTDMVLKAYSKAKPSPFGTKDILTLKSLLNELIVFGSYELLDRQIAYYCEDNLAHFYSRMFERMEEDYGRDEVKLILCLIVYSRAGLSEPEIMDISNANSMRWSYIRYAISHLLTLRNGKYYIDKITITKQIARRYGDEERQSRMLLVDYFSKRSDWSAVEECLFQYYHLRDLDSLYKSLLNLELFSYLYNNCGVAELLPYWSLLYDSGKEKYRIGQFADLQVPITAEYAHTFSNIGQFAKQLIGDQESANKLFVKSKDIYESTPHTDYDTVASVYSELEMYDKALEKLDLSIRIAELVHSKNDTYYPELLSSKASVLFRMDKTEDSIELWEEALRLVIQAKGGFCLVAMGICRNLSVAYSKVKDNNLCKDYIEKTIAVTQKVWGDKHVLLADAFFLYGAFHGRLNHTVEAIHFYQKALDIYTKWYPKNHVRILQTEKSIEELQSHDNKSVMGAIFYTLRDNLSRRKKDTKKYPLSDKEFLAVLNFFEGIADDLYLVDEDWEDGKKEYVYAFKYKHDCCIGNMKFVFGPSSNHVYISVDSSGIYHSNGGKTFNNLKDAQVNYLMRWFDFYEQYCDYILSRPTV